MADLREVVFQGLGEASMCWSETPKGVFDSTNAARIGEEIMTAIEQKDAGPRPTKASGERTVILKTTFIAEVIKWGMRQNPFAGQLPRKTEVILEKLNALLPEFIETTDMRATTHEIIEQIPEIRDWNLSQVEYDRGVKVDDPDRPPFAFASRYDQPKPEYDFIDLDALKQNITRCLEKEAAEYA